MAPIVHSTVEEIALYMYGRIVEGIGDDYLKEVRQEDDNIRRYGASIPKELCRQPHPSVLDFRYVAEKRQGNGAQD